MRIEYPMSENNVPHWGVWEMIREILQNAIDAGGIVCHYENGQLTISNEGQMDRRVLLLGESQKNTGAIGQFGEGMKLAMLVAARLKRIIKVYSGTERWIPSMQHSETFHSQVFCIDTEEVENDGITVILEVSESEWLDAKSKWIDNPTGMLKDIEAGTMFVGGLYVCKLDGFEYAYNFDPNNVRLNRDRDIPRLFDLQWETTRLLRDPERVLDLAIAGKKDILSFSADSETLASAWDAVHGDTVPIGVSEQDSIHASDRRIIPDWVAMAIRSVRNFIFRSEGTPFERLKSWREKYRYGLTTPQLVELDRIIEDLNHEETK